MWVEVAEGGDGNDDDKNDKMTSTRFEEEKFVNAVVSTMFFCNSCFATVNVAMAVGQCGRCVSR